MKTVFDILFSLVLLPVATAITANDQINPEKLQASINRVVAKVEPATVAVSDGSGTFSAVIVSSEGHVLSAGHAVRPNVKYQVILPDGREFDAVGLGSEPSIDMGLIKINAPENLPVAEMGWSATLRQNQPCISLGHPGRLNPERGVVVRFGRIADPVARNGMIQSTCLMEPGDSGGPLFDMQGRVIGIHSNIRESLDRNYEVPVDQFRRYWKHLNRAAVFHARNIEVEPDFGFEFATPERRRGPRRAGQSVSGLLAKVATVTPGTLAEKSGLQAGDQILSVNNEPSRRNLEAYILLQRAYTMKLPAVELQVKRGDIEMSLPLQLPANDASYSAWRDRESIIETSPVAKPVVPIVALKNLIEPFAAVESKLDAAAVNISSRLEGEPSETLATLIAPGNLLVSKSSLVGDSPQINRDGKELAATVVARDEQRDLVLLKLSGKLDGGIKLANRNSENALLGQLLLSPHPDSEGRVGVWSTQIFAAQKSDRRGFLGVMPEMRDGKVVFAQVFPNTPAATKFKDGDFVVAVDGKSITTPRELIEKLGSYQPGERVTISALRDGQPLLAKVTLAVRSSGHIAEYFEGGKSTRRDGFPKVFSHDVRLRPEECGGPLFTAGGEFVGVNIARFSRTRSYAVPAGEVAQFVKESLKN